MKTFYAAIVLSLMSLQTCPPAFAAGGIAYDSVMKFGQSAPSEPGDFAADYKSASQPAPSSSGKGGLFGSIGAAMGAAQAMGAMFSRGIAERYAILGSLIRTEMPTLNTATITDCKARTLTRLDLAKKTYTVTSLDSEEKEEPSSGAPAKPSAKYTVPPDTRFDVTVVNKALGPKTLANLPTNGFDSDMTMKSTANGSTQTTQMNVVTYVSSYAEPATTCSAPGEAAGMPNMSMMRSMVGAMMSANRDPRYTFHASGPELPRGKLALYTTMTAKGGPSGQQGQFVMIQERGNVRVLGDADASLFAIPAGFTKVKED